MLLIEALGKHRGPLSASLLATYGVRLTTTDIPFTELADLTANLPLGCAFWQSYGGERAWSAEQHALMEVEFRLRQLGHQYAGGKGKRPEPIKPPRLARERDAEMTGMMRAEARLRARMGQ